MEFARRRHWKLIVVLVLLAGLYWSAMFVGTHLPIRTTPVGDPYSLDKLEHLAAFGALAALLMAVGAALGFRSWKFSLSIFCCLALYAMLDESTQVSPRTPEILDWLADVVGTGVGIAIFLALARFRSATSHPRRPAA